MLTLVIFGVVIVAIYLYNIRTFNYWAKKGVKHDKPVIFFGTNAKNFLMKQNRTQAMEEMYWKYSEEKVVGFYRSTAPELVLRDPKIIKRVLVSDFAYFYARGFHPYPKVVEPMMNNMFMLEGDLWKMLRQRMTPAFSSGKLKAIFPMIVDKAEQLQARTSRMAARGLPIDARDLMARYTTDFIGCYGFGLDGDSLNKEDSEFRKLGYDAFNFGIQDILNGAIKEMFPALARNVKFFGRLEKRVFNLINQIQKSKGYKPSTRGDFVDLLLEYKQKGPIEIESIENFLPDGTPEKKTYELENMHIVAQTFLFFVAGFETSSTTSSNVLHQLAFNPEIQKKVQKEIDEVLAKHDNKLSYDNISEMKYLEWVLKEGMRLFPAVGHLLRVCCRQYTFEDIGLTIDPGVRAIVPVKALHMDPQYWENPREFRPERFHPDEFTAKQKAVYLPFGDGPRFCIGTRLGMMQVMAGIAAILSQFSVEPAPESVRFPEIDPVSMLVEMPKGRKLPLIFRKRN